MCFIVTVAIAVYVSCSHECVLREKNSNIQSETSQAVRPNFQKWFVLPWLYKAVR